MSQPGPITPLFVPAPADPDARARCDKAQARLEPFLQTGVLAAVDAHVAARLGALTGELNPEALLAMAFAVRAPRHGHVAADLDRLDASLVPDRGEERQPDDPVNQLAWPAGGDALREALAACADLVREPDDEDRPTPFVLDDRLLYMDRYWRHQLELAEALKDRAAAPLFVPEDPELLRAGIGALLSPDQGSQRLDRQQLAAAVAALRRLTVLSGGPGMGKTYTIRVVLVLLLVQWLLLQRRKPETPALDVALAAPTGKAANRMKEALNEDLHVFLQKVGPALGDVTDADAVREFITGLPTFTLHRLLGFQSRTPGRFRHDANNPLPQQVVVVDEASMVDLAMMAKLVDAVSPDARLLLIGDRHQLASVEAGSVLADICGETAPEQLAASRPFARELQKHCGLDLEAEGAHLTDGRGLRDCIVQLNRYHRFKGDSGIGAFARASLAGDPATAAAVLTDADRYPRASLLAHGDNGTLTDQARELIVEGYRSFLERLDAGPTQGETEEAFHRAVLDELDRFRILCAHRSGKLGAEGLNGAAEELLLKAGISGFKPRSGHYRGQPIMVVRNDYTVGRFNGDVGVVVRRRDEEKSDRWRYWVAFPGPGKQVEYLATSRLPEHETVFAMTIHKSQGSQFEHALVVLPSRPSPILTRELVYTGVTRAARQVTVLGDADLLTQALQNPVRRASGLGPLLWR